MYKHKRIKGHINRLMVKQKKHFKSAIKIYKSASFYDKKIIKYKKIPYFIISKKSYYPNTRLLLKNLKTGKRIRLYILTGYSLATAKWLKEDKKLTGCYDYFYVGKNENYTLKNSHLISIKKSLKDKQEHFNKLNNLKTHTKRILLYYARIQHAPNSVIDALSNNGKLKDISELKNSKWLSIPEYLKRMALKRLKNHSHNSIKPKLRRPMKSPEAQDEASTALTVVSLSTVNWSYQFIRQKEFRKFRNINLRQEVGKSLLT